MDGKIEGILDGGSCGVGVESTVVTLVGENARLLRPGEITPEQLRAVLGELEIDPAVTNQLVEGQVAASPGMKYKHYAPSAEVTLIRGSRLEYCRLVNAHAEEACYALCFEEDVPTLDVPVIVYGKAEDSESQAQNLFEALRELDRIGAKKVYAHCPSQEGVGLAVYNRMIRAAGFSVQDAPKSEVIGLTGPTGAGKGVAAEAFRKEGCRVVDADQVARDVVRYDAECLQELAKEFGGDIILPDGTLDRRLLASRAFVSPEREKRLNEITHPRILKRISAQISAYIREGDRTVVVDAPLLFESGAEKFCDRVLAVLAEKETRCQRICTRDGISREMALQRISVQQEDAFYSNRADKTLYNDGDAEMFQRQVREWMKEKTV